MTWDCEAYGLDAADAGALCFFAPQGERVCEDLIECRGKMAAERRRVFERINDLAAAGDETAQYLAQEFSSPDQLLGGTEGEP